MTNIAPRSLDRAGSTSAPWGNRHAPMVRSIHSATMKRWPRVKLCCFGVHRMRPKARPSPPRVTRPR